MEEITRSKISNEELRELEAEVLEVPLVVLSHTTPVEEMEAQCVALSDGVSVLGLDTETKPTLHVVVVIKYRFYNWQVPTELY